MKTLIIAIISILIVTGCNRNTNWGNKPFVEMQQKKLTLKNQRIACYSNNDEFFCKKNKNIGFKPDREYTISILLEANSNFKYKVSDKWIYNKTVSEGLTGDCEDIALTMASQMIIDGVNPKYLSLVYRKISDTEAHMFLAVETSDAGILHLDYGNSGYPIEPQINFHMKINNAGIDNWIKGNIKPEQ